MKKICEYNLCTGCGTCKSICPKQAVELIECEPFGHLYPCISQEKCIDCGLCSHVCPSNNIPEKHMPIKAYAAWNINDSSRQTSTSGGIADALYNYILSENGIGTGVAFDDNLNLNMDICNKSSQYNKFKNSKYCQSNTQNVFIKVKQYLSQGKKVIFIGTPCQCAGLRNFIKQKENGNLYIVDLICHGVPSNAFLKEYIKYIYKKFKDGDEVSFRGEEGYAFKITSGNKIVYNKQKYEDYYITLFLNGYICRESCYNCQFACNERVSDVTIGDYWGIGKEKEFIYSKKKVSCILVNSEKGMDLINSCDNIFTVERPISEAINGNSKLRFPTKKSSAYVNFSQNYIKYGMRKAILFSVYWKVKTKRVFSTLTRVIRKRLKLVRKNYITSKE